MDDIELASERVALAAEASRALDEPLVLTGRAENHIRGVDDVDDTIATAELRIATQEPMPSMHRA